MEIGIGLGITRFPGWGVMNIGQLFASGEQGAWYDPSDMSTLFQDSAGTVPVTAVEQPVGRILDKSGRGNHASQATTTKRPVLSRRVNLLTKTEQFDDAIWAKANATVVPNVVASPYGSLTADKLIATAASGLHGVQINTTLVNSAYKYRCFFKAGEYSFAELNLYDNAGGATRATCVFDLSLGTIVTKGATTVAEITAIADGWYLCGISGLAHTAGVTFAYVRCAPTSSLIFTGDGVSGIYMWGASLALATDAHLPYQRVNTATDYDADPDKFPAYRRADGVDDSLASSTGGGGTTGFFFSAAISPQGSAGTARTLFSDAGANTGYIVRLNASNQLELSAGNGTAYTTIATAGALNVGATDVVQACDDGTTLNVKIGSGPTASIARPVVVAGTAGYTLYQDNGASTGYFNGRSYCEIYRKDSGLTQSQREAVAVYQRQKARIA